MTDTMGLSEKDDPSSLQGPSFVHPKHPWSGTAHELLAQFYPKVKTDIVLIREQYRNKDPGFISFGLIGYR